MESQLEPSEFSPHMELDTSNIDAISPEKQMANDPPNACNGQKKAESGLMVCSCLLSPVQICLAHLFLDHLVFPKLF